MIRKSNILRFTTTTLLPSLLVFTWIQLSSSVKTSLHNSCSRKEGRISPRTSAFSRNDFYERRQFMEKDRFSNQLSVLRGGDAQIASKKRKNIIIISLTAFITITAISCYNHQEAISAFFQNVFNTKHLKEKLIENLSRIDDMGNKGLFLYSIAFAIWEFFGLTTSPIETAAALCFGWKRGAMSSLIGKFAGAMLAFYVGKSFLYNSVKDKLSTNEILSLVERTIIKKPLQYSIYMRFSCFPELIKNFGLSVMPLKPIVFAASVLIQGSPFSMLWAFLGNEAALQLQEYPPPPSKVLSGLLLGATIFGFVGSPALVGLWIRDMKKEQHLSD